MKLGLLKNILNPSFSGTVHKPFHLMLYPISLTILMLLGHFCMEYIFVQIYSHIFLEYVLYIKNIKEI